MYASGGMVVSIFHNYITNKEEAKYDSVESALGKYQAMCEMREKSPEWVDEGLLPAVLKAIRAAQKQTAEDRGIVKQMTDDTFIDVEEESAYMANLIAEERAKDPELDAEMSAVEAKTKVRYSKKE